MIWVALAVILVLLFFRVPVALSIIGGTLVYYLGSPVPVEIVAQRLFGGLNVFTLLAIPMFILVGTLMSRGGIADALYGFANTLVGHLRGGLAQVNVLNSVVMGGMSGSAIADASVDARVLVPVMVKHGYSKAFATGLSAASGIIAPILPPGIGMIVYGLVTQESVGRLFVGGVVPAILLALGMSIAVAIIARKRDFKSELPRQPLGARARAFVYAIPALLMPVILIFGLRGGVFTPTELSVFAVAYALLVGMLVYRGLRPRHLPGAIMEAVETSAAVMIIVAAGLAFGSVLSLERVPHSLALAMQAISDNGVVLLIIINIGLLLVGMIVDGLTALVLFAPVAAALADVMGWDPTHIGVMVVLNLTIGGITPPFGIVTMTAAQITGAGLAQTFRESWPFVLSSIMVLALVAFVPGVVTLLPDLMFGP